MIPRMILVAGAVLVVAAVCPNAALAQYYKGKTVTMIINYPAGGPTDIEGRIVAQHLSSHVPGRPTILVKNVGGAGGLIGSNQLGESTSTSGDAIGFFTLDVFAALVGNPSLRVNYKDFLFIACVENPLVVYARKDTPPGLKVATDIMKSSGFKALSLNARNSNTITQDLALDVLGVKYQAVPAYRGLKEVETAILQNIGQLANTSLPGWSGSIVQTMGDIVMPLWQVAPRAKDGTYPRSKGLPDLATFEEFFASVKGGQKPSGLVYEAARSVIDASVTLNRTVLMPPKTSDEAVAIMRAAFVELWKDEAFINDYAKVVKATPVLGSGEEGEAILASFGTVKPQIKQFLSDYADRLTTQQ